ncbi:MAG: Tad domain-containing protein [Anaerolineales bacterium]|nr:Tad domain-containing protein [Anaerolineales bacterium]
MFNKNKFSRNESGQALIMIVFAIIGLIGMTALTVDGGNAYSNRRHAQNAADTAAFAAARAKVRPESWKDAALAIASENAFTDLFPDNTASESLVNVEVYGCEETKPAYANCDDNEGNEEYIIVAITSIVKTYFAPIIGIQQVTNRVKAIARAKPSFVDATLLGNAMVSLMPGCKPNGWPHDPFTISGGSTSIVGGSGVFVNSDCDNAFTQNGSASMDAEFGVCVVGTSNVASGSVDPPPESNCGTPLAYPPVVLPNPSCDNDGDGIIAQSEEGTITQVSSNPRVYSASPGYYSGDFPDVSPSGKLIMQKGVYCIDDDFQLSSQWDITTDANDNGEFDMYSEGVLIMTENGGITLNGSSTLDLHAISDPNVHEDLRNLLFFMPLGNDSTLNMNGSSGSEFTGSIWAPSSHCSLEGNNTSYDVNSQLMCYSISLSGSANIDITYDENENHIIQVPPSIELTK